MTRKLILLFTFILIYGCNNADINDSSKRNENWVYWVDKKTGKASWVQATGNETTLKDGRYTRFYNSGEIYQKGKLKNGKDVDTIYFYDLKETVIQYLLVKPDTLLHYYLKNGPYISYSQNGKIFEKGIIENHQIGDEWTKYFDNGKIDWTKKLVNGTGWDYWYYKNGQISDMNYHVNGKTDGEVKIWFENGQIKEISHWKNGIQNGTYETYHESGLPKEKSNWVNGETEGKLERWFDNGKKESVYFYKNGLHHGNLKNWYRNGQLKDDVNFTLGQINGKVTIYFESGRIKGEGYYKFGNREGVFSHYDENGKLTQKETYVNGKLVIQE